MFKVTQQLLEAPGCIPKPVPLLPIEAGKRGGGKGMRFRTRGPACSQVPALHFTMCVTKTTQLP